MKHTKFLTRIITCLILSLTGLSGVSSLRAAPDDVDTAFAASAGQLFDATDFGSISSILVQNDGKIVFGSNEMAATVDGTPKQIPLIRFNQDGTVDNDFFADNDPDGAGTGIIFTSQGWPEVHALAQQADGKLIAAGVMEGMDDGTNQVVSRSIVRINQDGSVDPTYQTAGTLKWLSGSLNYIEDVTLQPDQKLIVSGGFRGIYNQGSTWTPRTGLARLNENGLLDVTFEIDPQEHGVPADQTSPRGWFRQAVVDSAGRIYVVGQFEYGGTFSPTIVHVFARLRPDGSRDDSFNPVIPASVALYKGIALDSEERVLFLGNIDNPATDSYLARFNPDGSQDASFSPPSLGVVDARPLRIDPQGRIYLAQNSSSLIRLNENGTLDSSFSAISAYSEAGKEPFFSHWITSPEGKVYSGAYFDSVNGVSTVKIVAFEGDSSSPNSGEFRFAISSAEVFENAGTLFVPVERSGGRTGAASIQYSTTTGSAGSGDYNSVSGTLSWGDGIAGTRYIEIPILNDSVTEGVEAFSISLGSPAGATLSGASSINASILDDDVAPVIITQPQSIAVRQGETAGFSVQVDSPVAVNYQWRKDDVDIPGANSARYAVSTAEEADQGNYSVVVTNPALPASPVTSDEATLTVIPPAVTLDPGYSTASTTIPDSFAPGPDGSIFINSGDFGTGFTLIKLSANGNVDTTFTQPSVTYEFVSSSNAVRPYPLPDGKVIITGNFTAVDGESRLGIARLNANGSLDNTFDPVNTDSREIRGVAVLPNGDVYTAYKPLNQSGGLRRFLDNGSFDPDFSSSITDGTSGYLHTMAEMPDGSLLVSHNTGGFGGVTTGIARLDTDGTPTFGFTPVTGLFRAADKLAVLPDGRFAAVRHQTLELYQSDGSIDPDFQLSSGFSTGQLVNVVYHNGRLIVAGPSFYGSTGINGLARFDLSGNLDDNFPGGSGPSSGVLNMDLDSNGRLLAQGYFTTWNGEPVNRLARLLFTAPEVAFASSSATVLETVGSLAVFVERFGLTDKSLSVHVSSLPGTASSPGDFAPVYTVLSWNAGETSPKAVTLLLEDDGTADGNLTLSLELSEAVNATIIPTPFQVTIRDDESLPTISSQPVDTSAVDGKPAQLSVSVSSPTPVSYQWYMNGMPIDGATAPTYDIASASSADEGAYYVVATNDYESVTSETIDVTIIPDPASIVDGFVGVTPNSVVYDVSTAPDGGAYVGGYFWSTDGDSSRSRLIKVNPDGSLDTTFNPPALSAAVRKIIVQPDGKILIAGQFSLSGDYSNRGLARLNPNGSFDTVFMDNIGSASGSDIVALGLLPDGKIVVGDGFTSWNGNSLSPNADLVRLNADGSFDGTYDKTTSTSDVSVIQALPDGGVIANGSRYLSDFSQQSGYNAGSPKDIALHPDDDLLFADDTIIKRNPDGSIDTTLPNFSWDAVSAQANGKILAGGSSSGNRFKRYLANGDIDPVFAPVADFNNYVTAIDVRPDGRIWVAGNFTIYNNTAVTRLVLLNGDPVHLTFTGQPSPAEVTASPGESMQLSASAYGSTPVSYQWQKDGVDLVDTARIDGATTDSLSITNLEEEDEGSYTLVITNDSGTETSDAVPVNILGAPEITGLSEDQSLLEGGTLQLFVSAYGASPISYQWMLDDQPLSDGGTVAGAQSATLEISPVAESGSGNYTVRISNNIGSVTSVPVAVMVSPNAAAPDTTWNGPEANGTVTIIEPLGEGRYLLAGSFTSINDGSVSGNPYIAVMNSDGSLVELPDLSTNGLIQTVDIQADDKILLGGKFTLVNGVGREHIARLNSDFSLDTTFHPTGLTGVFGDVYAIAQEASGTIMVGGNFPDYAGNTGTTSLVRLTNSGDYLDTFTSGAGAYNQIGTILPQDNGDLVFIGGFYDWSGDSSHQFIVRTDSSGTPVPGVVFEAGTQAAFASELPNGDFILQPSFNFFASKSFRMGPTAEKDTSFLSGGSPNDVIEDAAEDSDGNIVIGGNFTSISSTAGSLVRNRVARVLPDGSVDPDFEPNEGFNSRVEAVTVTPVGHILVGGEFTTYMGQNTPYLVRLKGDSGASTADPVADYLAGFGIPEPERIPGLDYDLDGLSNVFEFVYTLNPTTDDSGFEWHTGPSSMSGGDLNTAAGSVLFDESETYPVITVLMPIAPEGATVELTASSDLQTFGPTSLNLTQVGLPAPHTAGYHWVTYAVTNPLSLSPKVFLRLEIEPVE